MVENFFVVHLMRHADVLANHSRLLDQSVVRTGLVVRQNDTNMRASRPDVYNQSVLNLHLLVTNSYLCHLLCFKLVIRLSL